MTTLADILDEVELDRWLKAHEKERQQFIEAKFRRLMTCMHGHRTHDHGYLLNNKGKQWLRCRVCDSQRTQKSKRLRARGGGRKPPPRLDARPLMEMVRLRATTKGLSIPELLEAYGLQLRQWERIISAKTITEQTADQWCTAVCGWGGWLRNYSSQYQATLEETDETLFTEAEL